MILNKRKIASNLPDACHSWPLVTLFRRVVIVGLLIMSPLTTEAAWTVANKPDPVSRQTTCLLSSDTQSTSDGYDSTPVTLILSSKSLFVVTESELDPSFKDLQLTVDDKPSINGAEIIHKNYLVFDLNATKLAQILLLGKQVTVNLRFWPTWPATQSFPVRFSLNGFGKAYDELNQNCRSGTVVQDRKPQPGEGSKPDPAQSQVKSLAGDHPIPTKTAPGIVPALPATMPVSKPAPPILYKPEPPTLVQPAQPIEQDKPTAISEGANKPGKATPDVSSAKTPSKKTKVTIANYKKPVVNSSGKKSDHSRPGKRKASDSWGIMHND